MKYNINIGDVYANDIGDVIFIYGGCIDFCETDEERELEWDNYMEKEKIYFWERLSVNENDKDKTLRWFSECKKNGIVKLIKGKNLKLIAKIDTKIKNTVTV